MGGSLGFSKSKSASESSQSTFVDAAQAPFLQQLRQSALGVQQGQQGQIGQQLFGLGENLSGQGQQFLGGLGQTQGQLGQFGQAGFGQGQGGIDALQGIAAGTNPAAQALQQQAQGQNPFLQQQINQLGGDITRQFERGLGGIRSEAVGGGQLGGGRQGVAEGLLGESAQRQFAQASTQLRSQDIGRQLQASSGLLGFQGQAAGQLAGLGQQQGLGNQASQLQGLLGQGQLGLGGLEQLQGQFNLGFSPFQAQFSPLQSLAGIIGGPTVLSQGQSTGSASSFSLAGGVGGGTGIGGD